MAEALEVGGTCDPRFAEVKRAFARNFEAGLEIGASFAATVDGEFVVDLWAGHADQARRRPWERDTIVNVYSTTKPMTALCALMLVDRGQLDLDAPVARYWPEFAQAGKDALPVRYLLSNPVMSGAIANERARRTAEIPAANGHGNARSVARVAAGMACGGELDGVHLLSPATLEKTIEEQCYGEDLVLGLPIRWGLGFGLTSKEMPVGPNPRAFFWGGWGGSLVVIDLDARLSFSYVMNRMGSSTMGDTRAFGPAAALYGALSL